MSLEMNFRVQEFYFLCEKRKKGEKSFKLYLFLAFLDTSSVI